MGVSERGRGGREMVRMKKNKGCKKRKKTDI